MRIAYLEGVRIHIDDYKEGIVKCAHGHEMIPKRGTKNVHHFSHKSGSSCSCGGKKGDWHTKWQDRVRKEAQEVRVIDGKLHIADTLIPTSSLSSSPWLPYLSGMKGFVIEYQHSPMVEEVMRERESFYTKQGYHLVWVFDTSKWKYTLIPKSSKDGTITIRKGKEGGDFPLLAQYTGKVTKILDFGKKDLLLITTQKGPSITGKLISMEEFDQTFLGTEVLPDVDIRWDRHPI